MFRYMVIIIYEVPTDFSNFSFVIFLYRDFYFCTGKNIDVLLYTWMKNIVAQPMNMFVLELMFFFYWETDIFFTGAVICVLRIGDIFPYWSLYFCTEINISVLGYILLYWCIFYCTGKYTRTANGYVCVLRYRMQ